MENEHQKYILKIENINNSSKDTSEILLKKIIDEYKLAERESEILLFLSKGLSYSAIGKKLYISENTVKYHISNLYFKLDVKKKSEALNKFYEKKSL
jgi:DNA-binding CsgD family transcriptional regulator